MRLPCLANFAKCADHRRSKLGHRLQGEESIGPSSLRGRYRAFQLDLWLR